MPWEDDEIMEDDIVDDDLDDDSTDLLPCPACGAMIYEDSEQCPRCGRWVMPRAGDAQHHSALWWVGAGLALLGMLMWAIF